MAKWGKAWASVLTAFALLGLNVFPALAATGLPVPPSYTASDMVLTVTTTSPNTLVEMPINGQVSIININWGDGNSTDMVYTPGNQGHTYTNAGTYTVVISGYMTRFGSEYTYAGAQYLEGVVQWGNLGLTDLSHAFFFATGLTSLPSDLPQGVTNLSHMLHGASSFNQDISTWNTSSVTDMSSMFASATAFNNGATANDGSHPLMTNGSAWDVSNVTNFANMFFDATSFSEEISNWDTGSATTFNAMFWNTNLFNFPIGNWDVSNVTDFSHMFWAATNFNQDLSNWDTSSATDMSNMLRGAATFNNGDGGNNEAKPLDAVNGKWNLASVTSVAGMFLGAAAFNQSVDNWNLSSAVTASEMFKEARIFNQDISSWYTPALQVTPYMFHGAWAFNNGGQAWTSATGEWTSGAIVDFGIMFGDAYAFNQDISSWDTHSAINMACMFCGAAVFNNGGQPLLTNGNKWNVSNVTSTNGMFASAAAFNADISNWTTGSVTNAQYMFIGATVFNQNISSWDMSSLIYADAMFSAASAFNQNLNSWDVSATQSMSSMFAQASAFNSPLSNWDTSSVTTMSDMFSGALSFNQPIGAWDVSSVTNMRAMFNENGVFNQDLSSWNTALVQDFGNMFRRTSFDQDIGGWDTASLQYAWDMFSEANLSTANYNKLLIGWSTNLNKQSVSLLVNSKYGASAATARAILTGSNAGEFGWYIADSGPAPTAGVVTTPPTASSIVYGVPLSSVQLIGGDTNVPGTFAFQSPTTVPDAGTASHTVVFTPTDTTLATTTAEVSVTVTPAAQTLSWDSPFSLVTSGVYMSQFTASATSSAGLTPTYSGSGGCIVFGDLVTLTSPTTGCTVTASQSGTNNYSAAQDITQFIGTAKAPMPELLIYAYTTTVTYDSVTPVTGMLMVSGGGGTGARTWNVGSGEPCVVTDSGGIQSFEVTGAGTCHISLSQAGDQYYEPGTSNEVVITINQATPSVTFTPTSATAYTGVAFTEPVVTSNSDGTISYVSSDTAVADVDVNTGEVTVNATGVTTITAIVSGTNNFISGEGTYELTVVDGSQTLTWDSTTSAITSRAFGDSFTIGATATSGLEASYLVSGGCSLSGTTVTMTSGSVDCWIKANQAGDSTHAAATQITQLITATKATQSPLLASAVSTTLTYSPNPQATTTLNISGGSGTGAISFVVPTGDPCTVAFVGTAATVTATAAGICHVTVIQAADADYQEMAASQLSINIGQAVAVVTMSTTAQTAVLGAPFSAPPATTNSDGGISFSSSDTGVATVSATGAVSIVGTGVTTITASTAATTNYSASSPVSYQLTVLASGQVLTWSQSTLAITSQPFGASFAIGATSSASLQPTYAVSGGCTLSGLIVTMTSGTTACVITADQAGDTTIPAAAQISHTVNATLATQAPLLATPLLSQITYSPVPLATTTLSITGGSGVGALTFTLVTGSTCTVALVGAVPTVTATGAGTCSFTVTRESDGNYAAMTSSFVNITIAQAPASITMATAAQSVVFGNAFTGPTATTNSSAAITYSSSNTAAATVDSATGAVTIVGVGVSTISASAAANADFLAAPTVSYQLTVTAAPQTLSWDAATLGLGTQVFGSTFSIGASSSAALTPTYAATGGCTLTGLTVTVTSGTTACVLSASQAGGGNFAAAAPLTLTIAVAPATATITINTAPQNVTFGAAFTGPLATTNSTAAIAYASSNPAVATVDPVSGVVSIVGVGTTSITASTAATPNFTAASSAGYVLTVVAGSQVLSWDAGTNGLASSAYGSSFTVGATSSAALSATYSVAGGCSIAGAVVTMTSGTTACVITADQAGTASIAAATPITKTVAATLAPQSPLLLSATSTGLVFDPVTAATTNLQVSGGSGGGATSYTLTPGDPCTLTTVGGVTTLTATGAGSCRVTASRAADSNYSAATSSTVTITVAKATPRLTLDSTSRTITFGAQFTGALASTDSTAAIAYSSSNGAVATVDAVTGVVVVKAVGTTSISASTPANADFNASSTVSYQLTINAVPQSLSWDSATSNLSSKAFNESFNISATSSAGLSPNYNASGGCSMTGSTVSITSGSIACVITATQNGDATTASASSISKTITTTKVAQAAMTVSATDTTLTYNAVTAPTSTVTVVGGTGSGALTYSLRAGDPCSLTVTQDIAVLTATSAGVCRVSATRAGDSNYLASPVVSVDINVAKATGVLAVIDPPSSATFGGGVTPPKVDLNSVGTIRYTSSNPAVVDVDSATGALQINGVGSATITVSATASQNFTAPASYSYTVVVGPAAPAPPSNIRTTLNGTTLEVAWDTPAFTGGTAIEKYVATADTAAQNLSCTATAPATSCVIEGLNPGSDYTVAVEVVTVGAGSPLVSRSDPVITSVPATAVDPTPAPSENPTDAPADNTGGSGEVIVDERGLEVVNIAEDDPVAVAEVTVKTIALVSAAAAATAAVAAAGAAASAGAASSSLTGGSGGSSGGSSSSTSARPTRESQSSGPVARNERSDDANEMRDIADDKTAIDGITVENVKWGDGLPIWALAFFTFTDRPTHRIAVQIASRSPLLAKMILDGAYLRAMIGSLALFLPISAVVLGVAGVSYNAGVFLPPTAFVLGGLIVIAALDVMAAAMGMAVFCAGMVLTSEFAGASDLRMFFGLFAAVVAPSLLATSFRQVRREAATSGEDWWQRMIDMTVAPLMAAIMVSTSVGFLPALGAADFPIARSALALAFVGAIAMVGRIVLEEIAAQLYPARLDSIHPDELAGSNAVQRLISLAGRAAMFYFIALAIVGPGWHLIVGTVLFMVPPVLALFVHRLPNSPKLHYWLPNGLPAFTFSNLLGLLGLTVLLRVVGPDANLAQLGFALLPIPGTTFTVIKMFGREPAEGAVRISERESMKWVMRVGGAVLLILTMRLVGLI